MQALKAGWVSQAFALARWDDSREKKPRRRQTKEERRAMVKSFIKKYRTSNNGNFPSLNLTHKEVGGSFYTVREIVRDIIQENKVLGPGDASLKTLDLESGSEEHALLDLEAGSEEHALGSTNPGAHLSISSMMHVADHADLEISSMIDEHQSEESYDVVKSDDQEIFASHANDVTVAEVTHNKPSDQLHNSNGPIQCGNLVNTESWEGNLQKPSELIHNNTRIHEQNDPVPQGSPENSGINMMEPSHPFHESVPITSPVKGLMLNEKDGEKKSSSVAEATVISTESNTSPKITGTDVLPEEMIYINLVNSNVSDQLVDHLVSGAKDIPIASSSIDTSDLDLNPLETEGLINSQEVLGMQNSEVEEHLMPGNTVPTINRTKSTGVQTFSSFNKEAAVLTSMMSQSLVSPASGNSRTGALPVLQSNDMENIAAKTESVSSESLESLSPSMKEIYDSECSTKHEVASKTDRDSNCSRKSSGKAKSELEIINPVWANIKAFIDAVIKFWTE